MTPLEPATTPDSAGPAVREAPYWDTFRSTTIGRYLLECEQAFIAQHLPTPSAAPLRLLEIGTCTGLVTLPLLDRANIEITGLDKDFTALTMFQRRPGNHSAVMADASQLPFASSRFDAIVAIQCFRYFDPARFLAECRRVLDPNGWLILQFVNGHSYKAALKRLAKPSMHRRTDVFTARTVLDLLAAHGFNVCDVQGYNWVPFTPRITRFSDSRLIPYAARLERMLHLRTRYGLSPWVLVAACRAD